MKTRKRYRSIRRIVVALAAMALLVPSVSAALPDGVGGTYGGGVGGVLRPDDRPGSRGPGSAPVTDGLGRPLDPAAVRDESTQARPTAQEPRSAPPIVRMDGYPAPVAPEAPAPIVVQPTGFDWRDAGVGVAIGAAAVLALAAGVLVIGRRRDTLARV